MYLKLISENFSVKCKSEKLPIFAIVCQFTTKKKEIESVVIHFRKEMRSNDSSILGKKQTKS